ncbi:MAG: PD40 domain-containing protein [Candidatus Zixiibacteriota bacterium]|nr:MAG: PD40 domain-containing protein [candidate division Zixibacteria bacterium]
MKYKANCVTILISFLLANLANAGQNELPILTGPYLGQKPPGTTPELFAPGIVSSCKEHSAAMFTPDGNEVWFGRLSPVAVYHMKVIDGKWTDPRVASFCDTSTRSLYPVLSHDGDRVFFSSDRPIDQRGERLPRGDYHLWVVDRTASGWSEPRHLDDRVNFGRRQSCGSVAPNGDLYFISHIDQQSMNLFYSKTVGDTYSHPEELTELNSPSPDHCPFVAPDGSYLIFSSFRGGLGRSDLFISFRDENGCWSKAENMGPTVNSAFKDEYPYVTPDGKYLFFNSNRPSILNQGPIADGSGNIYWVDAQIIEVFRPQSE